MAEFVPRGSLAVKELLPTCETRVLENGCVLYTSTSHFERRFEGQENRPFEMAISPKGQKLIDEGKNLIRLLDLKVSATQLTRAYWGTDFATKENVGSFFHPYYIAVKRPTPNGTRIDGLEQFDALMVLKEKGVLCVTPLVATRDRFISRWLKGSAVPAKHIDRLIDYTNNLKEIAKILKQEGRWKKHWGIDHVAKNYRVYKIRSSNILEWFITFDPVAYSFNTDR